MTPFEIDVSARLTLHEFLLELLFANSFTWFSVPPESFERFHQDVMDRVRYHATSQGDGPFDLIIQEQSIPMAERFLEKVAARMKDIAPKETKQ